MTRRWIISRTNPEYINYISKTSSISPVFAQILINRGIKTTQEIRAFLNPKISDLSDPFEIQGMQTAVDRISQAVKDKEKIFIHGDYDADGLTSTSIIVHALRMCGLDVEYFIPNRILHGYGFSVNSVRFAKDLGASLIITVDCGITSFEAVAFAKQERIDVIITDHHEPIVSAEEQKSGRAVGLQISELPSYLIPEAVAVINPKLHPPDLKFSNLSGAGVAFKLAQALSMVFRQRFNFQDLLDLATIGTIADVVPLTGENRIIVREGIKLIHNGNRVGLNALKNVAGINGKGTKAELLSFTMIPRINAAGRVSDASDVVRLLLSNIEEEALGLSEWLNRLNSERQRIEDEVYQQALKKLDAEALGSVIVLSEEGWNQGIVGIVASRLAEEFCRPAFIFSVENGIAKGSARSILSFDICKGLSKCKELLISFGGHKQAAGIKLYYENLLRFEEKMGEIISSAIAEEDLTPSINIDADINLSDANHSLIKELSLLEPLGYGNSEPLFGCKRLEVIGPRVVGNNHLKMRLKQGPQSIDAIGFDMGGSMPPTVIDAVFALTVNEWEKGKSLQLNLKAFRPSQQQ